MSADTQTLLTRLQESLPSRKLKVKDIGDGGVLNQLLWPIVFLAIVLLSIVVVVDGGKQILSDRKIANDPVEVVDAMVDGSCKRTKLSFVKSCDVAIQAQGQSVKHDFTFIAFSNEDYEAKVLAQKDNPTNMNVDVAINHMGGRILVLVGFGLLGLLGLLLALMSFRAIPRRLKMIKNLNENQPWTFITLPVEIDENMTTYKSHVDGKEHTFHIEHKKNEPWLLNPEDNTQVIAIKSGETVLPLYKSLHNIDFTDAERQKLLETYRMNW
ncbi:MULTISPECIES: hypothetical protein [unclassified Acinetobacter]|uniref:hypothetical protein n=1 Tax=unclassified Acinetobacter TaxID=196816 RepID=UPI0035B7167C